MAQQKAIVPINALFFHALILACALSWSAGRRVVRDDIQDDILAEEVLRPEDSDLDCPPNGAKCCSIGDRWKRKDFLRQSLGLGVEQCLQVNMDLAQIFAAAGVYVPIQISFGVQGVYDFGVGSGTSGTVLDHRGEAERRKVTAVASVGMQVTIIPKVLYTYVTMSYQLSAFQKELATHPYILSMKDMIALVSRSLIGKKYISMRFSEQKDKQDDFVGSLLDMHTFTGGFPTDHAFLDQFERLLGEANERMSWPSFSEKTNLAALQLSQNAAHGSLVSWRGQQTKKYLSGLRKEIYRMVDELKANFVETFFNVHDSLPLSDCYTYYEAMLDRAYKGEIPLAGIAADVLQKISVKRDSQANRFMNETFPNGFSTGGKWTSSRGKHKRVNADPLWLCDKFQTVLYCRERLAMCMALNYEPAEDFDGPPKGTWPHQAINSFPEVIRAVNEFEKSTKTSDRVDKGHTALMTLTHVQPTFTTLYKAREGTVSSCEVRDCSHADDQSGEMVVDDLRNHRQDESESAWTMADELQAAVENLRSAAGEDDDIFWNAAGDIFYAYAPPSAPGAGLGATAACTVTKSFGQANASYTEGDCKDWMADVQRWGRSEQALWKAISSRDKDKIKDACRTPGLQIHMKNPFSGGRTFEEEATIHGVEMYLRACKAFGRPPFKKNIKVLLSFRPYIVQRLWMRTVSQAHLAIAEHHSAVKARVGTEKDHTVAKQFSLHYAATVSFAATLDVSYINFCQASTAPIEIGHGVTRHGKLVNEYSHEERAYVMKSITNSKRLHTNKFQIVLPDGSLKFFAETGEGIVDDDFDMTDLEKVYQLQMRSPVVMGAFVAMLGLSPLMSRLNPLVSRTITGEVSEKVEQDGELTVESVRELIIRSWEKQQTGNASSAFAGWFGSLGEKLLRTAHGGMTCDLTAEAVGAFLVRAMTHGSVQNLGAMIPTLGAQKAKDLYETAPVYAGAWGTGRLDMLVSHTSADCHKMLRPQVKAFFRAGFNAPFVSGAYTAAFYLRFNLPLTPRNMILPAKEGAVPELKQWCGIFGNPGQTRERSCREVRNVFEVLDQNHNEYLSAEELLAGFEDRQVVEALLGDDVWNPNPIDWKGFYRYFKLTDKDCAVVKEELIAKFQNLDWYERTGSDYEHIDHLQPFANSG